MSADLILYNARIHTQWSVTPFATAIAFRDGRVLAVGTDSDMLALAGRNTQQENLHGKTLIPGLIDAHLHLQWTATTMHSVDVFEVPAKQFALDRVREYVANLAPGEWVRGHGWAQDLWADRAFPTAADLDAIAPHNPVYLTGKSVHVAWANSAALERAGITAATPDPDGGKIQRDAQGNPTGILLEAPAMALVASVIPPLTPDQLADQLLVVQRAAHATGLTAVHDLDNPDVLAALQILRDRGQLSLRVTKYINRAYLDAAITSGLRFGFGDDWIRVGGLKLFADGALGPRTAYMLEPYEGEPDNIGIVVTSYEDMLADALRATANGLPTAVHAIGDRAVREVLDIFAEVRRWEASQGIPPQQRRHRIEHVQLIHTDDAPRLAQLSIVASMQPIHATSDALTADRYWGARAALGYNARRQLDEGAVVALGSDSPIEPFDPLKGIYAAVTRNRPDGSLGEQGWRSDARLTLAEAIHGFTVGAAYAAGLEQVQGRLAPGYYADAVLFNTDPYDLPLTDLAKLQVQGTLVGGVWRYRSS